MAEEDRRSTLCYEGNGFRLLSFVVLFSCFARGCRVILNYLVLQSFSTPPPDTRTTHTHTNTHTRYLHTHTHTHAFTHTRDIYIHTEVILEYAPPFRRIELTLGDRTKAYSVTGQKLTGLKLTG